jgi:hypothetical protein
MRRFLSESVGTFVCFAAVLGALVLVDQHVRDQASLLISDATSSSAAAWEVRAEALGSAIMQAARDQSLGHAPLLIFSVVAAVLVIFMLRT